MACWLFRFRGFHLRRFFLFSRGGRGEQRGLAGIPSTTRDSGTLDLCFAFYLPVVVPTAPEAHRHLGTSVATVSLIQGGGFRQRHGMQGPLPKWGRPESYPEGFGRHRGLCTCWSVEIPVIGWKSTILVSALGSGAFGRFSQASDARFWFPLPNQQFLG